jgi:hypothetical protein
MTPARQLFLISLGGSLVLATLLFFVFGSAGKSDAAASTPHLEVGANASPPRWYSRNRVYANLVLGNIWQQWEPSKPEWAETPFSDLDENGWIKATAPDRKMFRALNHPSFTVGKTNITCRYDGKAKVRMPGLASVQSVKSSPGNLSFEWHVTKNWPEVAESIDHVFLIFEEIDALNPVRNLDCRERGMDPAARFAPSYLRSFEGFTTIRYLGLQNTNHNEAVTWATRKKPASAILPDQGGIPIEDIIQLSNETGTNPWVLLPWNSDEAYIRNFATMMRDGLKPGLKVYVEMSNEVWNKGFKAARQAEWEGLAAKLSDDPFEARMKRYAQRSVEALKIWTEVFGAKSNRLVRVVSAQHAAPRTSRIILAEPGVSEYADALATAPYFGHELAEAPADLTLDGAFELLETGLDNTIKQIRTNRDIAQSHGKRYISYEGGQHVVIPNNVDLVKQINRDPRMGDLYRKLLRSWQMETRDLFVHIATITPISKNGGWGLYEYEGQPLAYAPKAQAMQEFLAK